MVVLKKGGITYIHTNTVLSVFGVCVCVCVCVFVCVCVYVCFVYIHDFHTNTVL